MIPTTVRANVPEKLKFVINGIVTPNPAINAIITPINASPVINPEDISKPAFLYFC